MEVPELLELVEQLDDNIEDLEDSLEPLLASALSATTKKLPVLDRAKLYVLIVYSIESLLFSYLRLNGVQAKEHAVFQELTRVKQYFEKIKEAEAGPAKPRENLSLNKQATGRIIKHALAGNDKYDTELAEREARERLIAARKLKSLESTMTAKAEAISTGEDDSALEDGEVDDHEEMLENPATDFGSEISFGEGNENNLPPSEEVKPRKKKKKEEKGKTKADKTGKVRKRRRKEKRES